MPPDIHFRQLENRPGTPRRRIIVYN